MSLFVVKMSHPDGPKWDRYVQAHVDYLKSLIERGKVLACGRVIGSSLRSGLIVFDAVDRREVDDLIAADPFSHEDIISALDVTEWDPLFGMLSEYSSGHAPELG